MLTLIKAVLLFTFILLPAQPQAYLPLPGYRQAEETPTPEPVRVTVSAPTGGEALRGAIVISGTTDIEGFQSAEISFAYQNDPTRTWFLIRQSETPVAEGTLATWDTTTISDGTYRLRAVVFLQDGRTQVSQVEGLRVRNYSPIETSTPAPNFTGRRTQEPTLRATATLTATPLPDYQLFAQTPVPQPTNPVQVTIDGLRGSVLRGGLVAVGALLVAGIYLGMKAFSKR